MVRSIAGLALLGAATLALATAGVAFIIPALIYRQWKRRMHVARA